MTPMSNAKEQRKLMTFTFWLIAELLASIAVPVSLFSWLGKRLDHAFHTRPKMLAAGILVSFAVSTVAVCQRALKYGEEYELLTGRTGGGDAGPPPADAGPSRGHPPPPDAFDS